MFDHAREFHIENGRFNQVRDGTLNLREDRSCTTIVDSGNSYKNNFNNSFNDNSRRERISHHNTTHQHGPINNIDRVGNVNLGANYGTLEMNHNVEEEEEEEEYPAPQDHFYGHKQQHRHAEPPRGYHGQAERAYTRDHAPAPPSTSDTRQAPSPFPRPIHRAQTEPPVQWGSKNPYLNYRADARQPPSQPLPPRGAPTAYPRAHPQARYEQQDGLPRQGSPFEGSHGYPPRGDRQSGYGHAPPRDYPPSPPRSSPRPGMNSHFSEPAPYHGQPHGRYHSRSPSPGYDCSDREDHFQEEMNRARRRNHRGTMPPSFDRAMDQVDRITGKMSRMRF